MSLNIVSAHMVQFHVVCDILIPVSDVQIEPFKHDLIFMAIPRKKGWVCVLYVNVIHVVIT